MAQHPLLRILLSTPFETFENNLHSRGLMPIASHVATLSLWAEFVDFFDRPHQIFQTILPRPNHGEIAGSPWSGAIPVVCFSACFQQSRVPTELLPIWTVRSFSCKTTHGLSHTFLSTSFATMNTTRNNHWTCVSPSVATHST